MEVVAEMLKRVFAHVGTKPGRLRLRGCRIQIILSIKDKSSNKFLLLRSGASETWGLPQEGVNSNEKFLDAIKRCLMVECGLDFDTDNNVSFERIFNIRNISYIDTVKLSEERHGERPITDHSPGSFLESIRLTKKAYWNAEIYIVNSNKVNIKVDRNEIIDYKWLSKNDASKLMKINTSKDKYIVFEKCMENM